MGRRKYGFRSGRQISAVLTGLQASDGGLGAGREGDGKPQPWVFQGHRVLGFRSPQEGPGPPPARCRRCWQGPERLGSKTLGCVKTARCPRLGTPEPAAGLGLQTCVTGELHVVHPQPHSTQAPRCARACGQQPCPCRRRASEGSSVWAGPLLNQMLLLRVSLPSASPPRLRPLATCRSF